MLKTRILLVAASAVVIWLLFLLPKVVVKNEENQAADSTAADTSTPIDSSGFHPKSSPEVAKRIAELRIRFQETRENEKSAIFADSLADQYNQAGKFDSAAWFAEKAATFFNTTAHWSKAGDQYYEAYNYATDKGKQAQMAEKAQEIYSKVLEKEPSNLHVKTKMAMTYLNSSNPMQGIMMLREVLAQDPNNEEALFNMGMLSIQSRQYDRAVERLQTLTKVNPSHVQAHFFLGVALMNTGDKEGSRAAFEKVKQLDTDPEVHATVDSYLKDLK